MKRLICLLLALVMTLSMIPMTTLAEEYLLQEEQISEETIPEETIPEETIPEETIPEETVRRETRDDVLDGETGVADSGICGDNLMWLLEKGVLTIFGTGDMWENTEADPNWLTDSEKITSVVIEEGVTSVGNMAFIDVESITSVTFPDSLKTIGKGAFNGCSITDVTIPAGVTEIGNYAFWRVPGSVLKTVTVHGSPVIGECAFGGADADTFTFKGDAPAFDGNAFIATTATIVYPADNNTWTGVAGNHYGGTLAWKAVGGKPITGTCGENVTWSLQDGVLTISGTGDMTDWVNIPDVPWYSYADKIIDVVIEEGVTSIGSQAFNMYPHVKSVVIPEGVTKIGHGAFQASDYLKALELPSTVTYIGSNAFTGCSKLTSIVLPEGLREVGTYAFYCCSEVKQINLPSTLEKVGECAFGCMGQVTRFDIPASLTQIGMNAFGSCRILEGIYVDADNPNYTDENGVLLSKDKTTLIEYPGGREEQYTIPEFVTTLAKRAFYSAKVTGVTFHDGITSIGKDVFLGCNNLTEVVLPGKLTSIPGGLFSVCFNLQSALIPRGVTSIGAYAFEMSGLTRIEIPAGVKTIEEAAFSTCDKLTEVVFAGNAPAIHEWAFMSVTATAYYPEGNATWTEDVMQNYGGNITWVPYDRPCDHYETILQDQKDATCIEEGYTGDTYCADCGLLLGSGSVLPVIDHDVGLLGEEAPTCTRVGYQYYGCSMCGDPEFEEVVELQPIGHNWEGDTCANCGGKTSGTCGENVTWVLDKKGTLTISGSGPMYDHDGSDAMWFTESAGVTKIIIEEGVTRIGAYSFFWAWPNLKSITIPGSVESIGHSAFAMCGLEEVILGKGVKTIEMAAFESCRLKDVVIPETVTYLGGAAFGDNRVINSITFKGDAPANVLDNELPICTNPVTIYYPADNDTWTDEVKATFGENITWVEKAYDLAQVENLRASSVSKDSVKIAYDKVEGAEEYEIYLNGEKITATSKLNYTIKNLTWGESYEVQVIAVAEKDGEKLTGKPSQILAIRPCIDLSEYKVSMAEKVIYSGEAQMPAVTVKKSSKTKTALTEGVDYQIVYEDNTDYGTATVTITGIGKYGGQIVKNFKIVPAQVTGVHVTRVAAHGITVSFDPVPGVNEYKIYCNGKHVDTVLLSWGVDPMISNLKVGQTYKIAVSASVTVEKPYYDEDGNYHIRYLAYEGPLSETVTAKPAYQMENCGGYMKYEVREYTGKARTNTFTLWNQDGKSMKLGRDYTVSYENNKNIGIATATLTGKGNYTGQIQAQYYIGPKAVQDVKAKALDGKTAHVTWDAVKYADYYAVFLGENVAGFTEETEYTLTGLTVGKKYEVYVVAVSVVEEMAIPGVTGDPVTVTPREQMENCTVSLSQDAFAYTGKYQRPTVTVYGADGKQLREGTDYTLSFKNNKNTGKAYVEVKGKGNYEGSVKEYYAINPAQVTGVKVSSTTKNSVKISYKKASSSSTKYYAVYVNGEKVGRTTSSSYTIKNLTLGEIYSVYVVPEKTVSGTTYYGQASDAIAVWPGTGIGSYKVTLEYTKATYTGEGLEPGVTVKTSSKSSAKTLTEGVDYVVVYDNNFGSGKAKVIIQGIGVYTGTITKTFTINPGKADNVTATAVSSTSIEVSFDAAPGATSYWVYVNGSRKAKITDTTCVITGLKKNKTYKITVKAVATVDGTNYTSDYTDAVSCKTPSK